jgi:asparagine synthase (glutamine-hydrolysing)
VPCYFLGKPDVPDYRFALDYAEMTGADFRVVPFDARGPHTLASLPDVVAATESFEPNVIQGAVCSWFAAQAIHKDGYRVALCGEGADELFCGYLPLEIGFTHGEQTGRAVRQDTLDMMARTCLQRIDRAPMHFQLEVREPFLDPAVVNYALALNGAALFETVIGAPRGKRPLRALYDLHADRLPQSIRHRSKVAFDAGVGLRADSVENAWRDHFEQAISDAQFRDGQREFAAYDLRSKEELFYIRHLSATMDISRVPHLKDRTRLTVPFGVPGMEDLRKVA